LIRAGSVFHHYLDDLVPGHGSDLGVGASGLCPFDGGGVAPTVHDVSFSVFADCCLDAAECLFYSVVGIRFGQVFGEDDAAVLAALRQKVAQALWEVDPQTLAGLFLGHGHVLAFKVALFHRDQIVEALAGTAAYPIHGW